MTMKTHFAIIVPAKHQAVYRPKKSVYQKLVSPYLTMYFYNISIYLFDP